MLIFNCYLYLRQITRHFQHRIILISFLVLFFYNHALTQDASQVIVQINTACNPALESARLTSVYYQQGQTSKAEAQHQITKSLLRQLSSLDLIGCAIDVEWVFPLERKKYPTYITEYSTLAFNEAIKTGNMENAVVHLAQKAGFYFDNNLFPETMKAFREFEVFFEPFTVIDVYESDDEAVRKAQLFKDVSRRYARFMYRTYELPKHRPLCVQNDCLHLGWEMQEKIKSKLFRTQIIRSALLRLNAAEQNKVKGLWQQDKELRLKRNQFYFSSRNFNSPTPYDSELQTVKDQIITLVPEYKELVAEIPKPEDISKVLEPNETLLSFFYNDNNRKALYTWVIERNSVPRIQPLTITTIEAYALISKLKLEIERGASIQSMSDKLSILQKQLIAPFNLRPNRKLIIAVDQNLSSLPFDILPWGTQGMMLDSFDIRYVPSATVFFHLRSRKRNKTTPEIPYKIEYAGFSYPNEGEDELDYANNEIGRAGAGFGGSPPNIIKTDASEADLYRNSEAIYNAKYLHLVTHSNSLEGIAGGFYLPFAKGNGEDGQLTSQEIATKLKNHAELVVLSACQTATSNENLPPSALVPVDPNINGNAALYMASGCICNYGESFSNLSGSFFAAGSKKLLLTQWLIRDDERTAEFVKRIFDSLRADRQSTDTLQADRKSTDALRLAKQKMRDDKTEKFPPVNWAGFILAGD